MKFERTGSKGDRTPRAYIAYNGSLFFHDVGDSTVLQIFDDGSMHSVPSQSWKPYEEDVQEIFYEGDSITITF